MFGDEFLFPLGGIQVLVDMKVMDKGEESFHDEVWFFIFDAVECDVSAWLEDVVAVVVEDALELFEAGGRDETEGLA